MTPLSIVISKAMLKQIIILLASIVHLSYGLILCQAATIQVNATSADDGCALDEAIQAANDNSATGGCSSGEPGLDVITFTPSLYPVYEMSSYYRNTATSFSATPQITSEIEVIGPDDQSSLFTLRRNPNSFSQTRAFSVALNGKLTLKNLSLQNFPSRSSVDTGGAIYVAGQLIADKIEITGSNASFGGAIWVQSGSAVISNSLIWGNTARIQGGGIGLSSNSSVFIFDSTISNNQSEERGGGIALAGSSNSHLSIINSTVVENDADLEGGGISLFFTSTQDRSTVNIKNSILSGNTAPVSNDVHFIDPNESGQQDIRYNLLGSKATNYISSTNSGIFFAPENNNILATGLSSGTPLRSILGPLKDNGGKTRTHALVENSPAIDAAIPFTTTGSFPFILRQSGCRSATPLGVGSYRPDQRGVTRPLGKECDIGAYEYEGLDDACFIINSKVGNVIAFCL
ncbi:right-handed parallel beta-helix repeat-containing protein [Arenicella sp.]|nr:right-handed parallel beta-helix repeat-containing protein [Arenicella sp.]